MSDIAIKPSTAQLDLLSWFASWTPEVHRADWEDRRTWPPGFRKVTDLSATWEGHEDWATAVDRLEVPPFPKKGSSMAWRLLPWGLLEGSISGVYRLTPRGRSALRLADRECPDRFESHCPEIFDHVPITPVVMRQEWELSREDRAGDPLPDERKSWRRMMVEYHEEDYRGRHTLVRASACLSRFTSTGCYFNGSMRQHYGGLSLTVENGAGQRVCEIHFSLEGFADLLSANGNVPATLHYYVDHDGMPRSEPAPTPVSPTRRMKERLARAEDRQDEILASAMEKLQELIDKGRVGKKAAAEIMRDLSVARTNGDTNRAYVVEQAVEELSVAVESMKSIASERLAISGGTESISTLIASQALLPEMTPEEESGDDQ